MKTLNPPHRPSGTTDDINLFDKSVLAELGDIMDTESLRLLVRTFGEELEAGLLDLSRGLADADTGVIGRSAHGLSSIAGQFGAEALHKASRHVDQLCRQEAPTGFDDAARHAIEVGEATLHALKTEYPEENQSQ